MKRTIAFMLFIFCFSIVDAQYENGGLISKYEGFVETFSGVLVVDGGGVAVIEMRNSACLEVWSTKVPLGLGSGGIMDLVLKDNSRLDYYGGETGNITIRKDASAYLYGGYIDYIKSMQFTTTTGVDPHIDLYAQPGWTWLDDDRMKGIEGQWMDGSSFTIKFINHPDFDPVYTNINVIIPEPATLLLLSLGGMLMRRKKRKPLILTPTMSASTLIRRAGVWGARFGVSGRPLAAGRLRLVQ